MRPLRLAAAAVTTLALATAGCGDDDSAAPAAASAPSGFPVTVEHALGRTTVPARPERVVAVGFTDHETLLALGIRPVGAMDWFGDGTYGRWPWERDAWKGRPAEVVSTKAGEIDFEKVAQLRPNLILGLYANLERGDYAKLSKIAPTVAQARGPAYTTPWRDMTRTAAKAVGKATEGEALIKRTEQRFARFRREHEDLKGRRALVADAGAAPKSFYPFTSTDPRGRFLGELGFEGSGEVDRLAGDGFGTEVAKERLDVLDVDHLFLLIDPPARKRLERDRLFNRLGVARRGGVTPLAYYSGDQLGAALAFSTVLSIPYALDGLDRALDGEKAFPVTLQTKPGTVRIAKEPQRVVALDFNSADALLALGVRPVAMAKVGYVEGGVQEWTRDALGGSEPQLFDADTDLPLERIAALRPDLIVGTNAYNVEPVYAKLAKIAPVVTFQHGAGVDTWQESTLLVGRAVGREARARDLVRQTEARVARARRDHPSFDGRTVTLFNYFAGKSYAISSPKDFSIRFLSSLGFRLTPAIAKAKSKDGRLEVSSERLRLLDADVVLGTSSDSRAALERMAKSELFGRLPAVRRGSYATLDIGPATSIAFPSALSIRYALDELVPVLERLTRGE